MGNINGNFLNSTADIRIDTDSNKKIVSKPGGGTVCLQNYSKDDISQIAYIGELFAELKPSRKRLILCESRNIKMKYTFTLTTPSFNINDYQFPTENYHGTGHITFISKAKKTCTSVQVCLEELEIDSNNIVTVTYKGYVEKEFPLNIPYKIDTCVTFMLNLVRII